MFGHVNSRMTERRTKGADRILAMHALYAIAPILCILAIAYRYYSAFIAARIMTLDDTGRRRRIRALTLEVAEA